MPGMTVLPQFQGNAYQLQQQQALAQALMQQSFQPQNTQAVGSGQYSIVPKYSAVGGLAQLGQALMAAKMQQNVAQGYNQLGQNQWAALTGSPPASSGTGGTSDGSSDSSSANPQALASALGSSGSTAPAQTAAPQQSGGLLSPGGPLNPNGIPTTAAAMMYMTPEGQKELFKSTAAAYAPTDTTRMGRQAGYTPEQIQQANSGRIFKDNYVSPNQYGPNMVVQDPKTGAISTTPSAAPAGAQNIMGADGKFYTVPVQGGTAAIQAEAAAKAGGEGSQLPYDKGVDASGNPLPVMSRTQAATGNMPLPMRNNNPGAVSPGGQVAQYPDMQTGLAAMDKNLASYAGKPDAGTLGGVITKWVGSPANAPAYIKDVTSRLGIPASSPVDLTNPAQRQAISTAIMLHENGPSAVFSGKQGAGSGGGAPAAGGAIYAAPPMGAQANAEATTKGQVDTMQKSYQNLQTVRSGAPAALQDVDNMSKLAQGASMATIGPAGAKFAGLFSANAAEYEKSRDNLVTNLGSQLGINSDAARDLVYGSIPSYGAPKQAVQNGLDTLRGQIQTRLLKSDYLSGAYTSGDAKAYNQKENQFDQNMTPAVANQVSSFNSMPTGPAKAQALKAAASNPQLRQRLEWAVSNGILK
jgi:hypothetical protein